MNIKHRLVIIFLYFAKYCGLFRLSSFMTTNGLRILCYHGIALKDEYRYRGTLFVRKELFQRRIKKLRSLRYPVLPLDAALEALQSGQLPWGATVVTMDDGWRSVFTKALPIIDEYEVPIVLYVSTHYIEHDLPVFSVMLSYLFWRSELLEVELPRNLGWFRLDTDRGKADTIAQRYGLALPPKAAFRFLSEMAVALDVSLRDIEEHELFRVLTTEQLQQLATHGVDIQLHTHRHQWSIEDESKMQQELLENRRFLSRFASRPLIHFCYPSGLHGPKNAEQLAALGVKSAVTIDPGFNYQDTPRLALKRIVDGESIGDIEFEAEIRGFLEIMRAVRQKEVCKMLKRRFFTVASEEKPNEKSSAVMLGPDFYDRVHEQSNDAVTHELYRPLFETVVDLLEVKPGNSVLEVGSGNGFLAAMILELDGIDYCGFDFSPIAVRNAGARTGRPDLFRIANALDAASYSNHYDTIVCTEVLEHIDDDLEMIQKWQHGVRCVCSVPNFDYESHVRFFSNIEEVRFRYQSQIDIDRIIKVPRPINPEKNVMRYLQRLRWSRDNPHRFLGYLGIQTFERLGGWFVFCGTKRQIPSIGA